MKCKQSSQGTNMVQKNQTEISMHPQAKPQLYNWPENPWSKAFSNGILTSSISNLFDSK